MKAPPKWAADALRQSHGPKWIIRRLLDSQELADVWDALPSAWRERLSLLPEYLGFMRPSQRYRRMPWTAENRPADQAAHAARVARLAHELNLALRTFVPLGECHVHQFFPSDDMARHLVLAEIAVAGQGDCLLSRVETMAKRFRPQASTIVNRPTKKSAWRTYLIRKCDQVAGMATWDAIGSRRSFVAGLVNALDPAAACDAEAVKESLRPRRGRSGDTNPT